MSFFDEGDEVEQEMDIEDYWSQIADESEEESDSGDESEGSSSTPTTSVGSGGREFDADDLRPIVDYADSIICDAAGIEHRSPEQRERLTNGILPAANKYLRSDFEYYAETLAFLSILAYAGSVWKDMEMKSATEDADTEEGIEEDF